MRTSFLKSSVARRFGVLGVWLCLGVGLMAGSSLASSADPSKAAQVSEGLRLFLTDWSAVGHEGSKGDGLGPVFNEKSCVACHGQGGVGGSGGSRVNVMILTDNAATRQEAATAAPSTPPKPKTSDFFPGFAREKSLVIHRYATDPGYELWRLDVLANLGVEGRGRPINPEFRVSSSSRNTPSLFGSGLIDAIPEAVLEAASLRKIDEFPEIKGRPGRLSDGRTGRFGWKAQTASLSDFVRIACANELGLENPGHSQSPDPLKPGYKAPGFDLTGSQCDSLASFVAALPRPVEVAPRGLLRTEQFAIGRDAFVSIGCAACHMPKLGDVEGIYSDLLLHDMGRGLSDSGEYYGVPNSPGLASDTPKASEWRTPPLWGLHDSAPYLHDGRASSVAAAVALHGGEGEASALRYKKLDPAVKVDLNLFLGSLTAPPEAQENRKAKKR